MRFGFFGYLTVDCKAAQAYLDARAAEGWALAEVWLGLVARFRRTDRTDLHYYVDIADPVAEDTPEHRARCREAGWERLYTVRYMNVYRSLPGAKTAPIHPEDAAALRRWRGNVLRWCAVCAAVMAALGALQYARFLLIGLPSVASVLRLSAASGASAFLLAATVPALACGLVYLFVSLRRVFQWRRGAEEGTPFPTPAAPWAKARGILTLLTYLGTALLVLFAAVDLVSVPTVKPVIFLSALTAAAFLVTVCTSGSHMRQPRRVRLWRCAGLAAFVVLVGMGRGAFGPAFDALRASTAAELPVLESRAGTVEAYSSLFLSYARADYPAAGADAVAEYYDCRTPRMARRMAQALWRRDMEPVEGREDAWQGVLDDGRHSWLSLRGDVVRLVSLPEEDGTPQERAALLTWALDEGGPDGAD